MLVRIITGVIGIALAALVIQTGGQLFALFALLLAILAWVEYVRAFRQKGEHLSFLVGTLGLVGLWGCAWLGKAEVMGAVITLAVLAIFLETVLLHGKVSFPAAGLSAAGIMYLGLPFAHLVSLRGLGAGLPPIETSLGAFEPGCALVWVMFIGTWSSDSFAYFVGSAIGKHKLCPAISPNKTIEGAVGAVVGTTAMTVALGAFFGLPLPLMALLGVLIAVFGTLGDLVESVAKRHTGIKDSGNIIPGHGGIWDRFDSVLFTAPLVYFFAQFFELLGR